MEKKKNNAVKQVIDEFNKARSNTPKEKEGDATAKNVDIPEKKVNIEKSYESEIGKETDPDLMVVSETVDLPSKGIFYENGLNKIDIEYMTSEDEDLLTTPSLIENNTAIPKLLKRKIKTKGVDPDMLLPGDRAALIMFLRTSSYGFDYTVEVQDPRTGKTFKETIDLSKLKYKEIKEKPDENGHFTLELPMKKKTVKIRLLTHKEEMILEEKAEGIREAYELEYSPFNSLRVRSSIVSIEDKSDRSYIEKFVKILPAGDTLTIRKKINEVSPGINMRYTFKAKDGYEFDAFLSIGMDFFFPGI